MIEPCGGREIGSVVLPCPSRLSRLSCLSCLSSSSARGRSCANHRGGAFIFCRVAAAIVQNADARLIDRGGTGGAEPDDRFTGDVPAAIVLVRNGGNVESVAEELDAVDFLLLFAADIA